MEYAIRLKGLTKSFQKEKVLKKKGTKEQSKENTLIEFVCALSREETQKILNQKDGVSLCFQTNHSRFPKSFLILIIIIKIMIFFEFPNTEKIKEKTILSQYNNN